MAQSSAKLFGVVFMVVMVIASGRARNGQATGLFDPIVDPSLARAITEFYPEERDALLQLRDGLKSNANLHRKWTGPPCDGNNTTKWPGIGCSNWHVTRIVLQGIQLTGSLPTSLLQNITLLTKLDFRNNSIFGPLPNLSGLSRLQFVFLSQNRFSGSIPSGYIDLPNLKNIELNENDLQGAIPGFDQESLISFNVSANHLEGKIPETSALQRFSESSFADNPNLCGKPLPTPCRIPPPAPPTQPPENKEKKKGLEIWSIALIAAVGALVLLSIVLLVLCCYYRTALRKKEAQTEQKERVPAEHSERRSPWSRGREDPEKRVELEFFNKADHITNFDLDDLLRASAEVLGKGKLSTTYKATLEVGSVVAVKRLKQINSLTKKEFIQQMQCLGNLKHENLVDIVSFYYSKEEKLIIYEYIPHGSLHQLLHDNRGIGRVPINWKVRLSIVKDIAKGLAYLHQSLPTHKVPHGNINSSNVLIQRDNNHQTYQSKLTDFGFLPLMPSRESSARLAVARSPEFCQGKKLSSKADVYCFGIVLLEVITGRNPGDLVSPGNSDDDLTDWVKTVVNNDWSTDILDMEILADKEGYNEMLKLTDLALQCTDTQPERRPEMSQVLRRIEEIEGDEGERKQSLEPDETTHHS